MGRNEEALESLRKATQVAPMRGLTWYWLSRGHMMDRDPASAWGPAHRAVEVEPSNARFLAHLLRVEIQLSREASAKQRLENTQLSSPELQALREQLGLR